MAPAVLASSAVGTVEYRSMTEAIRAANPLIENYVEGKAIDIDVENQLLTIQLQYLLEETRDANGETGSTVGQMHYDKLIVAVGAKVLDTFVPGADKFTYKLKTTEDARKLRTAIGECLEFASRPCVSTDSLLSDEDSESNRKCRRRRLTWVIVGAGPTGTITCQN